MSAATPIGGYLIWILYLRPNTQVPHSFTHFRFHFMTCALTLAINSLRLVIEQHLLLSQYAPPTVAGGVLGQGA